MTDKTALLALAAQKLVDALLASDSGLAANEKTAMDELREALAAQPAGAIAIHQVQWHEDNRTEWEDTSDPSSFDGPNWKHRTVFTAPPAASVDVEGLREFAIQLERDADGCKRDGYEQAEAVKRDCAFRLSQLINSAGGAKCEFCEGTGLIDESDDGRSATVCLDCPRCGK